MDNFFASQLRYHTTRVVKRSMAIYRQLVDSCLVDGSCILVSVNIYLLPQSYHKLSEGHHYFDQLISAKTSSTRITKLNHNTRAV
jgi:hypothetical protein